MRFGTSEYIPINKSYFLAEDRVVDFDIYCGKKDDDTHEPLLLIGRDSQLSNVKEIVSRKYFHTFYIRTEDNSNYWKFLEDSLPTLIDDKLTPLEKKSSLVYSCAENVIKDVLQAPRKRENIKRAQNIASNILNFSLTYTDAIAMLLKLGSPKYQTFTHCVNVAVFAAGLCLMIGKDSEKELDDIVLGCLLHDIGKAYIGDEILKKPGELTRSEYEEVKLHPIKGYEMMKNHLSDISLDIILHHHEKVSGAGYPHGLKDVEISDQAKIAAIADVYDALTTKRPYGDAKEPFKALHMMKDEMVGQFEQEKFTQFIYFLAGEK
ncbi:MAG: HD domain-containing protein [Proteobacteria bacterium]|nr:HD domain-containing protein [Pseudomonadota bacterium]MBU1709235.1 HD domain-containing protein [Pseudomonadota bacterium]